MSTDSAQLQLNSIERAVEELSEYLHILMDNSSISLDNQEQLERMVYKRVVDLLKENNKDTCEENIELYTEALHKDFQKKFNCYGHHVWCKKLNIKYLYQAFDFINEWEYQS